MTIHEIDAAVGRVLYRGSWRAMSMIHQQGRKFREALTEAGYKIVPTCEGCRCVVGEVRPWGGRLWHHDMQGNAITACTMPAPDSQQPEQQ